MSRPAARLARAAPPLAAALLSLLLAVPHLDWGLPAIEEEAVPAKQAFDMWGFAAGRPDLDPDTAGWPAFSFYAQYALQHAQYAWGRLTGAYDDRLDYWLAWQLDPTPMIVAGRALSAALLAAFAALGALIGRRVAGTPGAWLTGLLLAASPLSVTQARLVGPDAWVAATAAAAVLLMLRILARGRLRDYVLAGAVIGLGAASKYTPALLAVSLYLVHLERRLVEEGSPRRLGLDDRRLWLAALTCVLVFAAATPHTLLDLDVLRRDVGAQTTHLGGGHFGQEKGPAIVHYLNQVLPRALGWPALLAGVAGLVLARLRPEVRVLIWCLVPLGLVLGGLATRFDRYMLPLLPPLAAGTGLLVTTLARRWPGLGRRAVLVATAAVLVAWPLATSVRLVAAQGRPSTRAAAAEWLAGHAVGPDDLVATERYGPHLVPDPEAAYGNDPVFARLDPERRRRLLARPFRRHVVIPMYSVTPEGTRGFYDLRHFLGYDWLVTSGAVRERYLAEPERFPVQAAFYADLARWAPPAAVFGRDDGRRGPALRVHRLDESFRGAVLGARGRATAADVLAAREGAGARDFLTFVTTVAWHASLAERWEQAVPYAAAVRELSDASGRPDATLRLAVALFMSGEPDRARPLFAALVDEPALRLTAMGYLGVIAERAGDTAAAADWYRRVAAADPDGGAGRLARRRLEGLTDPGGE